MIYGVPASLILVEWGNIQPFFDNFAKRSAGRWTTAELLSDALESKRQVWKIKDWQALCLTSVGAECVNIDACAGVRRHEWQDLLDDEIRAWARSLGKKRIFAKVRPGWSKYGKSRGYKEIHREFKLEL